jgi:hypothetical protein
MTIRIQEPASPHLSGTPLLSLIYKGYNTKSDGAGIA